ncbi:MAG: transposase [Methanosarcinales archaeon]
MTQRARKTRRKARKLKIILVFLLPYSPDLNPIEQIWRAIQRELSPFTSSKVDKKFLNFG